MPGTTIGPRDNFFYLLASLLILVLLGPALTVSLGGAGTFVAEASLSLALVIAVWSLSASRIILYAAIGLVSVNLIATAIWFLLGGQTPAIVSKLSGLVFLMLSIVAAACQVFRPDRVDLNKIVGALCIYLIIGAIWAIAFQLLETFHPGSFGGLEEYSTHVRTARLYYFSLVTLTTLGYGDVVPLTPYAETLAVSEAVFGQFYLAVLVAGLIGAYLTDRENQRAAGDHRSETSDFQKDSQGQTGA
jgi:hypothetical protein